MSVLYYVIARKLSHYSLINNNKRAFTRSRALTATQANVANNKNSFRESLFIIEQIILSSTDTE